MEEILTEKEMQLDASITSLARNRQAETKLKEAHDYWKAERETYLAAFPNVKELELAEEEFSNQVETTNASKEVVKELTLNVYDIVGEKNVYEGVFIKEFTTFEINEERAIAWAAEHHHSGLKLNATEIKKVAKAGMKVDGVVIGKENRAEVASDLSSYLTEENNND